MQKEKKYKAKKSLGQNFLKSEAALRKIIEAGEIKKDNVILEIGPGKGALTEKLLEHGGLVIAVEKDQELFEFLKTKFEKEIEEKKLILMKDDILEFNTIISEKTRSDSPRKFSAENFLCPSSPLLLRVPSNVFLPSYKIIANIPYNITGAILKKFLTEKNQPERMILMVQHEVADRILARDGKESILSISVKAYGKPKIVRRVDKRYFSPAPKVDSAIISITNISRKIFEENKINEEKFWKIVKAGFAHKRKKLSGNLKEVCQRAPLALAFLGNKRAEDLKLAEWIELAKL